MIREGYSNVIRSNDVLVYALANARLVRNSVDTLKEFGSTLDAINALSPAFEGLVFAELMPRNGNCAYQSHTSCTGNNSKQQAQWDQPQRVEYNLRTIRAICKTYTHARSYTFTHIIHTTHINTYIPYVHTYVLELAVETDAYLS